MTTPKFISGGQTGPDQAGIKCARNHGYPTGGTACKGWVAEDGPAPWLAEYGLVECKVSGYPARTKQNVKDADLTVIFDVGLPGMALNVEPNVFLSSKGTNLAVRTAQELGKGFWINPTAIDLVKYIKVKRPAVINVAGNRASKWPEGFDYVYGVLSEVFGILGET